MMNLYEKTRILAVTLATEYDDPYGKMSTEEWEHTVRERELEIESDPYEVGILYSTYDDRDGKERDIEVRADLMHMEVTVYVDGAWIYKDVLFEGDLELTFEEWYGYACDRAAEVEAYYYT